MSQCGRLLQYRDRRYQRQTLEKGGHAQLRIGLGPLVLAPIRRDSQTTKALSGQDVFALIELL